MAVAACARSNALPDSRSAARILGTFGPLQPCDRHPCSYRKGDVGRWRIEALDRTVGTAWAQVPMREGAVIPRRHRLCVR